LTGVIRCDELDAAGRPCVGLRAGCGEGAMGVARVGRVVVLLVVVIGASPAVALAAGWSVVPSPNGQVPHGALQGVSCSSTSSCTAVGDYTNSAGIKVILAEWWNRTT
jgi:hypothetical protein